MAAKFIEPTFDIYVKNASFATPKQNYTGNKAIDNAITQNQTTELVIGAKTNNMLSDEESAVATGISKFASKNPVAKITAWLADKTGKVNDGYAVGQHVKELRIREAMIEAGGVAGQTTGAAIAATSVNALIDYAPYPNQ